MGTILADLFLQSGEAMTINAGKLSEQVVLPYLDP